MAYTVEITPIDLPDAEAADGPPTYALPLAFDTLEEAESAAAEHIAELGHEPGAVTFDIKDADGRSVAIRGDEVE